MRAAILAIIALAFTPACKDGPEGVDATVFDSGFDLQKDSGEDPGDAAPDAGPTDTGTITRDAGEVDGAAGDAEPSDVDLLDGELADGDQADAGDQDGEIADGDQDGAIGDGGVDPDGGDAGPVVLTEDFSDPVNEVFTCPNMTMVLPGLAVENGTQCLGIDASGCPDVRGLPGPGAVECSDPNHNPFIGTGQCVSDFFACFDPMGTCANDGMGTFTWGNGAMQVIQVDGMGLLIRSEFIPSNSAAPCIVGLPDAPGGTTVIYTQQ